MSQHFKERHALRIAEGGEGRIADAFASGVSWSIRWIGKNLYRIYLESPDKFTLTGSADSLGFSISKGFRLVRIEWSFNDNTSKDLVIKTHHPHMNQLGYPTRILNLSGDLNEDGMLELGEKYEYEGGAIIEFVVTGTSAKTFSPTVYVQILGEKS